MTPRRLGLGGRGAGPARPPRRRRERALLVALGLLVSVAGVEGLLRMWTRDVPFQPDPELITSLRPRMRLRIYGYDTPEILRSLPRKLPRAPSYLGMGYTNNVGLPMRDDVGPKERGERRILFLGDSFASADRIPDEQRFYRLVQESLGTARRGGEHWRVINAAIPGGAPSQYTLQLRRYLGQFQPDVVLAFIAPNDASDDLLFERTVGFEVDSRGVPLRPKAWRRQWILQRSLALRSVPDALRRLPRLRAYLLRGRPGEEGVAEWQSFLCGDDRLAREWFSRKTGRYIVELKEMAEAGGARFGVFLLHYMYLFEQEPFYEPQHPGLKEKLEAAKCLGSDARSYQGFLEGFLEQHGIRYRNSFEAMRLEKARDPKRKLWQYHDHHFSADGNRVVAREVLDFLAPLLEEGPGGSVVPRGG